LQRRLAAGGSQENIRSWLFRVAHYHARNRQNSYQRGFGEALDAGSDSIADEATPERVSWRKKSSGGWRMRSVN
jgi:DNA-directed RNA polymerase specialized sigma24 family protein